MQGLKENKKKELRVGIADWKICCEPCDLITLGLGSCVGIALWDSEAAIGGLAHIMLPDSTQFSDKNRTNPAKFADLAIPLMWEEMYKNGARLKRIRAKIAGGAQMFLFPDKRGSVLNIGERNVVKVKSILKKLGIRISGEDTGGNFGRTMIFKTVNGEVYIRTVGNPLLKI